jgi:hypothetical protein
MCRLSLRARSSKGAVQCLNRPAGRAALMGGPDRDCQPDSRLNREHPGLERAKKLRDGESPARWKGLLDEPLPARSTVAPT